MFLIELIALLIVALHAGLWSQWFLRNSDFVFLDIGPQPPDWLSMCGLRTGIRRDQQGTIIRNPRHDQLETGLTSACPQSPVGSHLVPQRQATVPDHGKRGITTAVGLNCNQPKVRSRDCRVDSGPRGGTIESQKATLEQINVTPVPVSVSCVHGSPKWR